jgi:uncharacterized protein (TIGR03437 family)
MSITKCSARSVSALLMLALGGLLPSLAAQHVPSKIVAAYDRGPVDPAFRLPFVTLVLKPSTAQQADLERLIEQQTDRSSPNYRKWLTPEQFAERFALAQSDYTAAVSWLESHNLHIEQTARARNWITFSGAARDVEEAFQTRIHRYVVNGQEQFANSTEISLPSLLHDVAEIRGLDDFWRLPSALEAHNTTGSGLTQLAPDDWATIYNVAPLYAMGIDGSGQRVGILGRSSMSQSYIDTFRKQFGLPPTQVEQHLIGPDPGVTNAAGEAALDLEWSGAIARGATIVYIYAANFNDAAQGAIDQNLATVLSESFGTCEPQSAAGLRLMAQQASAQGITWVASSGDSGAAGCDAHGFFGASGSATQVSDGPAVSMPASFPEVTAIGGTQFNDAGGQYWRSSNTPTGASAISYIPEMVWNETGAGGLLASGGGASIYFPKPAWQTGAGVLADNARDVPDISFSASGNHDPYMVVNANGQRATGGTSAGAPSFAGVVALLNQSLVSRGVLQQPGLGMINPNLYRLASAAPNVFHDITQGSNIVPCTPGSAGCLNGSLGAAAGPGYDLATGLGSVDVLNLITQWDSPAADTTTSVSASPVSIAFGGSVQITATVSTASAALVPGGTVTFTQGRTLLGSSAIRNVGGQALATLTVTGARLPAGTASITASYSGDANFSPSRGSTNVPVGAAPAGSYISIDISPNPAHAGQFIKVSLTELAGVSTTVTGWTINGVDDFPLFTQDFRTTTLPAYGTLSAVINTANPAALPSARLYIFSGVDGDGRKWSQQYTLTLQGSQQTRALTLASAPEIIQQNPNADSSCQWSQQLMIQEQRGFAVQLTKLVAGTADWTSRIQQLFGTTHLAPLGMLEAHICWPGPNAPPETQFEMDGVDQTGEPVTATVQATYAGAASAPSGFSVAKGPVILTTAAPNSAVAVDSAPAFSASVLPANRSTAWLTIVPTGLHEVLLTASSSGLAPGVYNATLVVQAPNAIPQLQEVPVVFLVGNTNGISIGGVAHGASFQQAFAPGAILSVFGTQLASATQPAAGLPLPLSLGGASATINGVPAPLYYVSPTQLNIQIPYETGSGPAVLGVNNNGSVAFFTFSVTPSAPGIFTDLNRGSALVPVSSAKRGDTLLAFLTGEGEVSPSLSTGATPFPATPLALLPRPAMPVTVTVGGIAAPIAFAGIPPGLAGVTQVNFVVPNGVLSGPEPVVIMVGAVASPPATINVE